LNITDVGSVEVTGDRLVAIFQRQGELVEKYQSIEKMPPWPMNIDLAESQKWFKDFAWRMTEEIGEAITAISEEVQDVGPEKAVAHFEEEMADALHFFVELCIIIGIEPKELVEPAPVMVEGGDLLSYAYTCALALQEEIRRDNNGHDFNLYEAPWITTMHLAKAMNCLKNKPWKQTQMITDAEKFKHEIRLTFVCFLYTCIIGGMDDEILVDRYFRKSVVNNFRIRSNY